MVSKSGRFVIKGPAIQQIPRNLTEDQKRSKDKFKEVWESLTPEEQVAFLREWRNSNKDK